MLLARALAGEQKAITPADLHLALAHKQTASGKRVSLKTAVQVSTVFACCKVVGEGLGQVPLRVMQNEKRKRTPATDHPAFRLLNRVPCPWLTSFEFRELIAWHTMLAGNFYAFKNVFNGKILELIPFEPNTVKVKQKEDYSIEYEVTGQKTGRVQKFPAESIWHVRGPSVDGVLGIDVVKHAREAVGLAMATEEAAGSLHKHGVRTSGIYSVEGKLGDDGFKQLKSWIEEEQAGSGNAGKALIMDRGAKWHNTQMSGVDAQSYETRRFQIEEICRYFRVLPIMIGHADKTTTYASAEHMFLHHLVHTLAPWFKRLEDSMNLWLLGEKDLDRGFYTKFNARGLLRGSSKDEKDVLLGYTNGGLITRNEAREILDLPIMDDPKYDELLEPRNITGKDDSNSSKDEPFIKPAE